MPAGGVTIDPMVDQLSGEGPTTGDIRAVCSPSATRQAVGVNASRA